MVLDLDAEVMNVSVLDVDRKYAATLSCTKTLIVKFGRYLYEMKYVTAIGFIFCPSIAQQSVKFQYVHHWSLS